MADRETFLAGIRQFPEDSVRRLAYADFVQESGDEDLAALIRVGVLCCDTGLDPAGMTCILCDGKGWRRRCEEDGCGEPGYRCGMVAYTPDGEEAEEPEWWYCGRHAPHNGFCHRCGGFFGGVESFDFSRTGMCSDCEREVQEDEEADAEDSFDGYFDDDDSDF